eukprot:jgi/Botrbrau1/20455/Bobra.145_2s0019.1
MCWQAQLGVEQKTKQVQAFVEELKQMPIAINTDAANEQHYEVPSEYFLKVLGKHLKYSCCLYPCKTTSLDDAEEAMLELYCQRAQLDDGMDILDLGCGWGSLSLFLAEKYPNSQVLGVSNSSTQKALIDERAQRAGLKNLKIVTADIVRLEMDKKVDRILSIEMFEHMKNYQKLMQKISTWLKPGGMLFVHIFVHRSIPYHFEVVDETDWMAKYFFTGGTMPSDNLLLHFQEDLVLKQRWRVSGMHYHRTLEDWLVRQDRCQSQVLALFKDVYGKKDAFKWVMYWRLFYMACSELFRYNNGNEWFVSHYLFSTR